MQFEHHVRTNGNTHILLVLRSVASLKQCDSTQLSIIRCVFLFCFVLIKETSNLFIFSLSDSYRKLCQCDSWFECKPPDRSSHSEKQANDSGYSGSGASGDQHRGLPQSETVQQSKFGIHGIH